MAGKFDVQRLFAPTPAMAERVKQFRIDQGLITESEAVRRLSRLGLRVLASGSASKSSMSDAEDGAA